MPVDGAQIHRVGSGIELAGAVPATQQDKRQRQDASQDMDGVDSRKHIEKRAVGAGGKKNSYRGQFPPCRPLPGKERNTQTQASKKPAAEAGLLSKFPAGLGNLQGETAQQQQSGVNPQYRRGVDREPIRPGAADQIGARKAREQH